MAEARSAFAALRPDAADKTSGAVRQAQNERVQQEKRAKENRAKERKRVRDAEKERIDTTNAEIARLRGEKKGRERAMAPMSEQQRNIEAYLDTPPYYGESDFGDKDEVRRLCGGPEDLARERHFHWDHKLWGTRKLRNLPSLVASDGYGGHLWWPCDIDESWGMVFLRMLNERLAEDSSDAVVRSEERREASMAGREPVRNETQRRAAEQLRDQESGIRPATPEERDLMARHGVTDLVVRRSKGWASLGPLVGLSLEGRIERFLMIFIDDVRHRLVCTDAFYDRLVYEPLQARALLELVNEWDAAVDGWDYPASSVDEVYAVRLPS
tara:strand:- start:2571 stop:3551 length:981 start_codon:yes stop_codon:yes gene_type:complete